MIQLFHSARAIDNSPSIHVFWVDFYKYCGCCRGDLICNICRGNPDEVLFMEHERLVSKASRPDWENATYLNRRFSPWCIWGRCYLCHPWFLRIEAIIYPIDTPAILPLAMVEAPQLPPVSSRWEGDSPYLFSCRQEIPKDGNSNISEDTLNPTPGGHAAWHPGRDGFY